MGAAAIPLVAEEAVGATTAELTAEQIAAQQLLAEQQAAAALEAQQAAQAAAEQAAQAAAEQTTTGGISDLVHPTTAPVNPAAAIQNAPLPQAGPPAAQPAVVAPPPPAPPPVAPPAPPPTGPDVLSPVEQAREAQLLNNPYIAPPYIEPPFVPPSPDAAAHISRIENLSGIETLAKEVGAQSPALPSPVAGPPAAPGLPGLQTNLASAGANLPPVANAPVPIEQDPFNFINNPKVNPDSSSFVGPRPEDTLNQQFRQAGITSTPSASPPVASPPASSVDYGFSSGLKQGVNAPLDTAEKSKYALGNQTGNYNLAQSVPSAAATATATPEVGGLQGLYNDFKAMPLKDKALTGMLASSAYQMLNPPKPYEPKKYKSTFKPGLYTGYQPVQPTPYQPQYAHGGLADLGGYSDGGRMLKGPGDGMSDDIPATIANKQPARLANEEFVIPADVVSHLGNGSSEAGAKVLYKMMDRVRQARTGNKKQGKQINPEKYLA